MSLEKEIQKTLPSSETMRQSENSLALRSDTGFKPWLNSLPAVQHLQQVLHLCESPLM